MQKARHDTHAQTRQFSINQPVMAKNWSIGPEWVPATISEMDDSLFESTKSFISWTTTSYTIQH